MLNCSYTWGHSIGICGEIIARHLLSSFNYHTALNFDDIFHSCDYFHKVWWKDKSYAPASFFLGNIFQIRSEQHYCCSLSWPHLQYFGKFSWPIIFSLSWYFAFLYYAVSLVVVHVVKINRFFLQKQHEWKPNIKKWTYNDSSPKIQHNC